MSDTAKFVKCNKDDNIVHFVKECGIKKSGWKINWTIISNPTEEDKLAKLDIRNKTKIGKKKKQLYGFCFYDLLQGNEEISIIKRNLKVKREQQIMGSKKIFGTYLR